MDTATRLSAQALRTPQMSSLDSFKNAGTRRSTTVLALAVRQIAS